MIRLLFFFTLAALSLCPVSAQTPPDAFQSHIQAAQTAVRAGLPLIAAGEYRAALALHPTDADAAYALGGVLEQAGQTQEAMAEYRTVIRLRPDFTPAHNALAGLLEDAGQTAAALAQYRQALALEPRNPLLHFNLGAALDDAGRGQEAQAEYREALRLKPDFLEAREAFRKESLPAPATSPIPYSPVLFQHGRALEAVGRVGEAAVVFRAVLRQNPRDAAARLHLGIALYADGQASPARTEWARVLTSSDTDAVAQARRLLSAYPALGAGTK